MELFSAGVSAVSQGWERSVMTMALLKGLLSVYCTGDRTDGNDGYTIRGYLEY